MVIDTCKVPLVDESGAGRGVLGIFEDITTRLAAEQALRESEEKFRLAFVTGLDAVYWATLEEGRLIEVNPVFEQLFGYSREEIIGKTSLGLALYKNPTDRAKVVAQLKLRGFVRDHELEARRKNGELFTVSMSISTATIRGERFILGVLKDITKQKQLQAELQQSQKLESLGRLAGGVAHDFNNLLGVILGCGEILQRRAGQDTHFRKYTDELIRTVDRATALTRQLLAFSRKQVLQPRVLDLNAVITDVEKMLRRMIGEDIALVTELDPEIDPVRVDPGQVEQVLMNLAVNARDAMPQGGQLTIRTERRDVEAGTVPNDVQGAVRGRCVLITVSDTGMGMSEDVRVRAFEPFFTTKGEGKGTGLGLSTVHGIVAQSGGHIYIESRLGRGTTFCIYLPSASTSDPPVRQAATHDRELPRGTETILLVEDDANLREIARECIEQAGYTVVATSGSEEALGLLEAGRLHIDLLLTDVVMPGMNGRELAERFQRVRPDLKVLYMSGYTNDATLLASIVADQLPLIEKPFSMEALGLKLRQVFDGAPRPT